MAWKITQGFVWILGIIIIVALLAHPAHGIDLFWNILIPLTPLLIVLAAGLWRNICPLATTALLPQKWGLSKKEKPSLKLEGCFSLTGVCALLLIVPLRHPVFNLNGPATAILILAIALVAILASAFFNRKSAWCSGLCPIHPVEKLYGMRNRFSFTNAHCDSCCKCVAQCPDANANAKPFSIRTTRCHRLAGLLMAGGFPGFVWGWFQVPDSYGVATFAQLLHCYQQPFMGLIISCALFLLARRFFREDSLTAVFSAAAVSCYYWFRLPALFGFGLFPGDGMLVDLSHTVPAKWIYLSALGLALFCFWWLVLNPQNKRKWLVRPAYAKAAPPSH